MHEPKPKPKPESELLKQLKRENRKLQLLANANGAMNKRLKAKEGRPKREFTNEQVKQIDGYALINCKDNQIATLMGIPSNTFKQHFGERCKQKRAEGQAAKMKQQYNDKTPTMLIWWGKQHLEQTDKSQLTGKDGGALDINVRYVKGKK